MEADKNFGKTAKRHRCESFCKFIKALYPVPYLIKAKDYYIGIMMECAGRVNYSGMDFGAPGAVMSLNNSFSTTSFRNEEDFRELVRAASQRSGVSRSSSTSSGGGDIMLKTEPRSLSMGRAPMVGRIDEESPCYFSAVIGDDVRFPRSRSCNPQAMR